MLDELFDEYSKLAKEAMERPDDDSRFGYIEALRDVGLIIRDLTKKYDLVDSEDLQRHGENDEPRKVEIDRTGEHPNE